jgi:hypothetical protein
MTEATIARIAITTGCSYEQAAGRLAALTPHGRLVEPDEVAERELNLVQRRPRSAAASAPCHACRHQPQTR